MASITIIRGLNKQGAALTAPLVSVYAPTGIEFDFDRGSLVGSYAEVSVSTHVFKAVKVSTVGNVDRYQLAVDWLQYLTSLPTSVANITPTSITYTITGRNVDGVSQATATDTILLSFGCPEIYSQTGLYDVYIQGASSIIYHCGKISFFNHGVNVYEIENSTFSGTYEKGYGPEVSIDIVYKQTTGLEIAWINSDGAWSFWNFKQIAKTFEVKKSNFVPKFSLFNYEANSAGQSLGQEKTMAINFKTVAINAEHHEQLCRIKESPLVIFGGRIVEVKECTQTTGSERQNLAFTLTLETKENAASN